MRPHSEAPHLRRARLGMERDLAIAAEIYRALLPEALPTCDGYEVYARTRPADATSGDVYDVIARPDGSLFLLLADATGHGIGPALSATQLRSMVRMALRLGAPLERIVAEAEHLLIADLPSDRFVTAFLGEVDPTHHTLSYRSAGQGPLLHWHARTASAEWRNASGPPFGVTASPYEEPFPMHLQPGDLVVLATDGVFERSNEAGKQFGRVELERVLREVAGEKAEVVGTLLEERMIQFGEDRPQEDDASIVVVKRRAHPVTSR